MTVVVLATGGTYGIDEGLVIAVLDFLPFSGGLVPVLLTVDEGDGLVGTGKSQPLVVVAEICGNALPQGSQFPVVFGLFGVEGVAVEPSLVVGVDDDVHVLCQTPVDNFLDALQPRFLDNHRRLVGELFGPADRYADGIEPHRLDILDHFLSGLGVAPSRLSSAAFERVAEIPAHHYVLVPVLCAECHARIVGSHVGCNCMNGQYEQEGTGRCQ